MRFSRAIFSPGEQGTVRRQLPAIVGPTLRAATVRARASSGDLAYAFSGSPPNHRTWARCQLRGAIAEVTAGASRRDVRRPFLL